MDSDDSVEDMGPSPIIGKPGSRPGRSSRPSAKLRDPNAVWEKPVDMNSKLYGTYVDHHNNASSLALKGTASIAGFRT